MISVVEHDGVAEAGNNSRPTRTSEFSEVGPHAHSIFATSNGGLRLHAAQRVYGLVISPCVTLEPSAILGDMNGARDRVLSEDEIFAYWRAATRMPYPYGANRNALQRGEIK
jgi:hypothetical protein